MSLFEDKLLNLRAKAADIESIAARELAPPSAYAPFIYGYALVNGFPVFYDDSYTNTVVVGRRSGRDLDFTSRFPIDRENSLDIHGSATSTYIYVHYRGGASTPDLDSRALFKDGRLYLAQYVIGVGVFSRIFQIYLNNKLFEAVLSKNNRYVALLYGANNIGLPNTGFSEASSLRNQFSRFSGLARIDLAWQIPDNILEKEDNDKQPALQAYMECRGKGGFNRIGSPSNYDYSFEIEDTNITIGLTAVSSLYDYMIDPQGANISYDQIDLSGFYNSNITALSNVLTWSSVFPEELNSFLGQNFNTRGDYFTYMGYKERESLAYPSSSYPRIVRRYEYNGELNINRPNIDVLTDMLKVMPGAHLFYNGDKWKLNVLEYTTTTLVITNELQSVEVIDNRRNKFTRAYIEFADIRQNNRTRRIVWPFPGTFEDLIFRIKDTSINSIREVLAGVNNANQAASIGATKVLLSRLSIWVVELDITFDTILLEPGSLISVRDTLLRLDEVIIAEDRVICEGKVHSRLPSYYQTYPLGDRPGNLIEPCNPGDRRSVNDIRFSGTENDNIGRIRVSRGVPVISATSLAYTERIKTSNSIYSTQLSEDNIFSLDSRMVTIKGSPTGDGAGNFSRIIGETSNGTVFFLVNPNGSPRVYDLYSADGNTRRIGRLFTLGTEESLLDTSMFEHGGRVYIIALFNNNVVRQYNFTLSNPSSITATTLTISNLISDNAKLSKVAATSTFLFFIDETSNSILAIHNPLFSTDRNLLVPQYPPNILSRGGIFAIGAFYIRNGVFYILANTIHSNTTTIFVLHAIEACIPQANPILPPRFDPDIGAEQVWDSSEAIMPFRAPPVTEGTAPVYSMIESGDPSGLSFDASGRWFSGTPNPGNGIIVIRAKNDAGEAHWGFAWTAE